MLLFLGIVLRLARPDTGTGFAIPGITIIIFSARHAHLHYVQSTCIGGLTLIRAG